MTSGTNDATGYPVANAVDQIDRLLTAVTGVPFWSMPTDVQAATLRKIAVVSSQLSGLDLGLFHQADLDGLGSEVGAADAAAWWANTTKQTKKDTKRRSRVAAALAVHPITREALAAGHLAEDQATEILRTLEVLVKVESVPDDVVELAEKELVRLAEHHDALDLHRIGKRILLVVAPEVGEEQLKRTLEREAKAADESCRFTMSDDGNGKCHGKFTVPSATGAALKKAAMAIAAPKHRAALGLDKLDHRGDRSDLPGPHRMGQAFCEYIDRYPTEKLPNAGGVNASVVVTMTMETLLGSDQLASLDTGQPITAAAARKMACEAGIIPVVLGGKSQPLDVGRAKRFHTTVQRTAIALRDKTCTAEGCDWPPAMCHVHHDEPWSKGGATNVEKGRLLCPRHHSFAHQPKYTMKSVKNGRVVFARC